MRTFTPLAGIGVLMLALIGCSAPAPADGGKIPDSSSVVSAPPAPGSTDDETTVESEFSQPTKNSRGNLVKAVGELAGTTSMDSNTVTSRFTVTDIVLDIECRSRFSSAPVNGHYLGIHFNIETTPELAAEIFPSLYFSRYDWQAYGADGKRLNDPVGNSWSCLESSQELPSEIGPGQSVSGWIVLDVAETTGSVVLAMGGPTGWEWAY